MRIVVLGVAALCLAAPARAQTGAEPYLGKWSCASVSHSEKTVQTVEYLANGTFRVTDASGHADLGGGALMEMALSAEGTWSVRADGKLVEQPTRVTVISATMSGKPMQVASVQASMDESMAEMATLSSVVHGDAKFVSTDENGVVTACTR